MQNKMWAFLIHLGSNMWFKKGFYYGDSIQDEEEPIYHDKMWCDRDTWRKVTDFLPSCGINTLLIDMGEAVRLDSHPELAIEGSWSKEEFRQELARLRSIGLTPLPKYNFSAGHNAWLKDYAYMIGTDIHNRVCKDIIEETIDLFDTPEFFHLGLEEEDPVNQGRQPEGGQPVIIIRTPRKKTSDALELFDTCLSRGVRPWIWADYKSVDHFGGEKAFRANIPTSVLMSNFYYSSIPNCPTVFDDLPNARFYRDLNDWGYEQVPTSSTWEYHLNSKMTMRLFNEKIGTDHVRGFMTASWFHTTPRKYYALLNDAFTFYNARKDIFGE